MEWEDKQTLSFWLPWPRQMNKVWREDFSSIYLDYVKMQGRYKEGKKKDYVGWKAGLRVAMNKDKCIKKLKAQSQAATSDGIEKKLYQIIKADLSDIESCNENSSTSDSSGSTPNSPSGSELSTGAESVAVEPNTNVSSSPTQDPGQAMETSSLTTLYDLPYLDPPFESMEACDFQNPFNLEQLPGW